MSKRYRVTFEVDVPDELDTWEYTDEDWAQVVTQSGRVVAETFEDYNEEVEA